MVTVSTYFDVLPWDLDIDPWVDFPWNLATQWYLGKVTQVTPKGVGSRSPRDYLGSLTLQLKFLNGHYIFILWWIFVGLGHNCWVESHKWPKQVWIHWPFGWLKFLNWSLVHVFTYFGVYFMRLGHNVPWVELHLWPQQKWVQRPSRGHQSFG